MTKMKGLYCLKCKDFTSDSGLHPSRDRNGRPRMCATCEECGTQKYKYLPGRKRGGMLGSDRIKAAVYRPSIEDITRMQMRRENIPPEEQEAFMDKRMHPAKYLRAHLLKTQGGRIKGRRRGGNVGKRMLTSLKNLFQRIPQGLHKMKDSIQASLKGSIKPNAIPTASLTNKSAVLNNHASDFSSLASQLKEKNKLAAQSKFLGVF